MSAPTYTATLILNGRPIVSHQVPYPYYQRETDKLGHLRLGYITHKAYFCPLCGEIWARDLITSAPQYNHPITWTPYARNCPEHGGSVTHLDVTSGCYDIHPSGLPRVELESEFLRLSATTTNLRSPT